MASAVPIQSILHLVAIPHPTATPLSKCGLPESSQRFIDRWLDVTKSNLLFARGLLLVEGIAEAILLPILAKIILKGQPEGKKTLDDMGISIINLNGIYFKHFMQLFCNINNSKGRSISIRCAGLTDLDPVKRQQNQHQGNATIEVEIKPHKGNKYPAPILPSNLLLKLKNQTMQGFL